MIPVEFDQEKVNQILLGEGSLRKLKPFFPNQEAILNYHAQRMAELFPPNKNTNECECCHRHSVEFQSVFEWRGIYHTTGTAIISTLGIAVAMAISHHLFHFLMPSKQVSFSTAHGLCGNCFEQIKRRRIFVSLVKQLCLVFIITSALIFTSVIVFTLLFLLPQPTTSSIIYAVLGFCGGLLFLAGGLLGGDWIVRWCLPKSVRFISKPPFQLVGFHKLRT